MNQLKLFLILTIFFSIIACSDDDEMDNEIIIPANSIDALSTAINSIPVNGTIILAAGNHTLSGSAIINKKINIRGEDGTKLILGMPALQEVGAIHSGIHFKGGHEATIENIEFVPDDDIGGNVILVENSNNVRISDITMINFEFGILIEKSNNTEINNTTITGHSSWQPDLSNPVYGLVVVNGDDTKVSKNHFSNCIFGAWNCGKNGSYTDNTTTGNYIGMILCNVPASFPLANGNVIGSDTPATNWSATKNNSFGNFYTGYSVTDGSDGNFLSDNLSSANGGYDYEVLGDSNIFGFFTPTASNTTVILGQGQSIKDCGVNTTIQNASSGIIVDTSIDPCI
jgi:nitrous oxidase accessory protein NosD